MEFVESGTVFHHFVIMSNELTIPSLLVCPIDSRRKPASSFASVRDANLSYFVGVDTSSALTNAFLAGDRNLRLNGRQVPPGIVQLTTNTLFRWTSEIHKSQGNVALADGSVQQFNDERLTNALHRTGLATNRLAVP